MPTKANGPLQADYRRLIRAAKREGAQAVVYHSGGATIVIPLDQSYLEKLAQGHLPSPDADTGEGRKPISLW